MINLVHFIDINFAILKQITYLLKKYFENILFYIPKIIQNRLFIVCKNFKGINNNDYNSLFAVVEKLYVLYPTGGIYDPTNYVRQNDSICKNNDMESLFEFKYTEEFNKQFNKIIEKEHKLKKDVHKIIEKGSSYNINLNDDQIKKIMMNYSNDDLKANIQMAHHYGLSVKPKFLDYDKKYETMVLENSYTIDTTIIKHFAKYNEQNINIKIIFNCKHFDTTHLKKYKNKLNLLKFMMGTRDWKKFSRVMKAVSIGYTIREFSKKIMNIPGSRAFFKLYEILFQFPNLLKSNNKKISTLHICEAPGKFIAATNHYIKTKTNITDFKWNANALNPFSELTRKRFGKVFGDDYGYIKKYRKNWLWGKDGTGDITDPENIKHIVENAKNNLGEISFMTSDCGIDVSDDYNTQELQNTKLNLSHVIIALMALKEGGNVVFKVYLPMVECLNISLTYLLYCKFEKVSFVKQLAGSPYNSEIYIVCENYQEKINKDTENILLNFLKNFKLGYTFIPKDEIPKDFMYQYEKFIKELVKDQKEALNRIFYYYDYPEILNKHLPQIDIFRNKKAQYWIKMMNIQSLDEEKML